MYVTTDLLKSFAREPSASQDAAWTLLAEASSRAFDREVGVADGFFEATATSASTKTIRADGAFSIKLPPFVTGSLTTITPASGFTFPSYRLIDTETGNQWLEIPKTEGTNGLSAEDYAFATGGSYSGDYISNYPLTNYQNIPVLGWTNTPFDLTVTAKWGWLAVPSDIQMAVIQHALGVWRNGTDPAFAQISDVTGRADKSIPLFVETAKLYREKFNQKALFG